MTDETRLSEAPPSRSSGDDDTLPASSPPDELAAARATPPPRERYRLGAELGRGGMGRVVEAFDVQLLRTVALKEVLPQANPSIERRFVREVQITARLEHASIVPLYDSGTMPDGRPYYVMRKVAGQPLDEKISRARGIGERLTLLPRVLAAIDAIAHAHKRGIIHRDLKPANILVGEHGETVVIDWGLAKVVGESQLDEPGAPDPAPADSLQTQVGAVFGTPGFMPPEQARGDDLGPRSDVFALGATLYQLLAGSPPLVGKSATEVIEATHKRAMLPVAQAAPGAPAELVAIVDKALAFEPEARYPDAGALGEDVRRFLDGQLVAAHRYTRRERVARFVRRHRAVMTVATLATLALVVVAWVSITRIIAERDAANHANVAETAERHNAEKALAALRDEQDELLLERAQNFLVAEQPAHAVATLKRLSPDSKRIDEARGIAASAATRGMPWAIPASNLPTTMTELDRDGRRLVQVTFDGIVHVFDLELHREVLSRQFERFVRAIWVGDVLLVTHEKSNAELLDPRTGSSQPLSLGPMREAIADDAGDRAIVLDAKRRASALDVATRTLTPLGPEREATQIAIAPGGEWYAVGDKSSLVIYDRDKRELARRDAAPAHFVFSPAHRIAVLDEGSQRVTELALDAVHPLWETIPPNAYENARLVIWLTYRGRELELVTAGGIYSWDSAPKDHWRWNNNGFSSAVSSCWRDVFIYLQENGRLRYIGPLGEGTIHVPSSLRDARLAGRYGRPRLAAVARGVILVFHLDDVLPDVLGDPDGFGDAAWLDNDTLLIWPKFENFIWYDLRTQAQRVLVYEPLSPLRATPPQTNGMRILLEERMGPSGAGRVVVMSPRRGARVIAEAPNVRGALLPDDSIVYSAGDGRILAVVGEREPYELAVVRTPVETITAVGDHGYAAITVGGELVRGSVVNDTLERASIATKASDLRTIAGDRAGAIYVSSGNHLWAWRDKLVELPVNRDIGDLAASPGGALVALSDNSVLFVRVDGSQSIVFPASTSPPVMSRDGRFVSTTVADNTIAVAELPDNVRWSYPVRASIRSLRELSPDGTRLLQQTEGRLIVRKVPRPPHELLAWLDELTNATLDGTTLVWPWQQIPSHAHP